MLINLTYPIICVCYIVIAIAMTTEVDIHTDSLNNIKQRNTFIYPLQFSVNTTFFTARGCLYLTEKTERYFANRNCIGDTLLTRRVNDANTPLLQVYCSPDTWCSLKIFIHASLHFQTCPLCQVILKNVSLCTSRNVTYRLLLVLYRFCSDLNNKNH